MNNEMKQMMDEDKEIWAPIEGYEGYEISTKGRVRSYWKNEMVGGKERIIVSLVETPSYLAIRIESGYLRVHFGRKGKKIKPRIHRLMAIAFLPNLNNLECVDHIDGNTLNNSLSNLRWCSKQQNILNSKIQNTNTSGTPGVYFRSDGRKLPWIADWRVNGSRKTKSFATKEEAIAHRRQMVEQHYDMEFYNER